MDNIVYALIVTDKYNATNVVGVFSNEDKAQAYWDLEWGSTYSYTYEIEAFEVK